MRRVEDDAEKADKEDYTRMNLFLLQNLPLQLGLGQRCQSEG